MGPGDDCAGRATPRVVWWLVAAYAAVLLGYTVLVPAYVGPDEPYHVDLSHAVGEDLSYPQWDGRHLDIGLNRSLRWVRFSERSKDLTVENATPRSERPAIEDLRDPPQRTQFNQMPQHPPLYYAVTGGAERLVDALPGEPLRSFDMLNWFYRLLSVLMVASLPLIIWKIAARLGLPDGVGIAAAMAPLAVPQFTHIMALANNDSLAVVVMALVVMAIVPVARGDLRLRPVLIAGCFTGLALFTKGMTVVLPFWGVLAIALGWWRGRRDGNRLTTALRATAVYGTASILLGGWWWIRNVLVFDELAPSTDAARFQDRPGFTPELGTWLSTWFDRTNQTFWGSFGRGHVAVSSGTVLVASIVAGVLLLLAFWPRAATEPVTTRLLLLAMWPVIVLPIAVSSYTAYARSGQIPGSQGRYWFGAMAPLAVLVAIGAGGLMGRFVRFLPLLTLALVVAMQVNGVTTLLQYFWGGPGASTSQRLDSLVAWSPLPSGPLKAIAAVSAVVLAGTLWQIVRSPFRPTPTPPVDAAPGEADDVTDAPDGPSGPDHQPAPAQPGGNGNGNGSGTDHGDVDPAPQPRITT